VLGRGGWVWGWVLCGGGGVGGCWRWVGGVWVGVEGVVALLAGGFGVGVVDVVGFGGLCVGGLAVGWLGFGGLGGGVGGLVESVGGWGGCLGVAV